MDDKEVGTLLQQALELRAYEHLDESVDSWLEACISLLCKLVTERARVYSSYDRYKDKWIPEALRDFGIDQATWEKTNGNP